MVRMGVDEYIGHRTRDTGGGGSGLLKWRDEKESRSVDVWFHRKAPFTSVWSCGFPRISEYQKEGRTIREAANGSVICIEPEEVLRRQSFRDRETDERETPPTIDPMCLLIEHVRGMIRDGSLKLTDELFRVAANETDRDARIIHAGGFCGLFKEDKLSDDEKDELAEAKISLREAWMESALPRCNYIYLVVNNDRPEDGVQIAKETSLLGDKVKEVIGNEIERRGSEKGNPIRNPYPFRWKHFPAERVFHKKYNAIALDAEPDEQIAELITESDLPDISRFTSPPNYKTLRAQLESYCLYSLDWDAVFGPVEKKLDPAGFYIAPEPEKPRAAVQVPGKVAAKPKLAPKAAAKKEPEPEPEAEPVKPGRRKLAAKPEVPTVPCDECKEPMPEDATVCGACGAKYELEEPAKPAAAKPSPKPAAGKPKPSPKKAAVDDGPGDSDVPF